MKKIIIYLVVSLAIIFTACEKPDIKSDFNISWSDFDFSFGPGPGYGTNISNRFDSVAFSYINIPSNRYFIYKDESTGALDSAYVNQGNVSPVFVSATASTPLFSYQTFTLTLRYEAATGNQPWLTGFASCDTVYRSALFIDSDFTLTNTQTNLPCFWFPFTSSGLSQYSFMPTLSIEGTQYNTVHKFSATNGLQPTHPNYLQTVHYWVKGIGIIKKEIRTYNSIKTSLLQRMGDR